MENLQNNHEDYKLSNENKSPRKRMPVWKLIVIDVGLAAVCLGVFMLYHLVIPKTLSSDGLIVATEDEVDENTFQLPGSDEKSGNSLENNDFNNNSSENYNTDNSNENNSNSDSIKDNDVTVTENEAGNTENIENSEESKSLFSKGSARNHASGAVTNYSNTNTSDIAANSAESESISTEDKVVTPVDSYNNDNVELTVNKVELGSGSSKITYYVSDIYVSNVKYLKTAFATGVYGKNLRDDIADMAVENDAILAISGDFYGNSEISVVIRNGVLYRDNQNDADVCVLFTDGAMKTYSPEEFDADEVIKQGAWQAWTFGPALLDGSGNILDSFNTTDYIYSENPRSAIGYVEPGHYVFVVVDGRDPGYSKGASLNELAQIMVDEGCNTAYNLDGGKSAAMFYDDAYVNQPAQGGRTISDIIYIGE